MRLLRLSLPLALAAASPALAAQEAGPRDGLAPYQMVRSLQLVQDRIAGGDHAALPMQRKLLEMIDARFRAADSELFADPKNFRSLLVYAMSGGNPATVGAVLARLHLDERSRAMGTGILDYLSGRPAGAQSVFRTIDPKAAEPGLGAFLSLVKGSLLALDDAQAALPHLDYARLLAPGTLVEEAALRRSIPLAAAVADRERFLRACEQYVRRYLRSPYASQFAEAFVDGVVRLADTLAPADIDAIVAGMTEEQRKVVYLRIARFAAIENHKELSAFASERALALGGGLEGESDPRAALYASMSSVTSGTVEDVLAELRAIDRTKLSAGDRKLLEAAEAIAAGVLADPVEASAQAPVPAAEPAAAAPAKLPVAPQPATAPANEAADLAIDAARQKIEAIDALLKEETN